MDTEEDRYTITCRTVGCPNRDAGPWRILGGVVNETYHCARCGQLMAFAVGWDIISGPTPQDWNGTGTTIGDPVVPVPSFRSGAAASAASAPASIVCAGES